MSVVEPQGVELFLRNLRHRDESVGDGERLIKRGCPMNAPGLLLNPLAGSLKKGRLTTFHS